MDKEDVLAFEDLTHIKVSTKGNGFVTNQSITKGQALKNKDKVEVTLSADKTDDSEDDSNATEASKIRKMKVSLKIKTLNKIQAHLLNQNQRIVQVLTLKRLQ